MAKRTTKVKAEQEVETKEVETKEVSRDDKSSVFRVVDNIPVKVASIYTVNKDKWIEFFKKSDPEGVYQFVDDK